MLMTIKYDNLISNMIIVSCPQSPRTDPSCGADLMIIMMMMMMMIVMIIIIIIIMIIIIMMMITIIVICFVLSISLCIIAPSRRGRTPAAPSRPQYNRNMIINYYYL